MILPGYNEGVRVGDVLFHVQTEHHEAPDKAYIETQIFRGGKIVLSRRFERPRREAERDSSHIVQLRKIHRGVVERLRQGQMRKGQLRREQLRSGREQQAPEPSTSLQGDRTLRKLAIRLLRSVGERAPVADIRARLIAIGNIMALIGGQQTSRAVRGHDLERLLRFRKEIVDLVRAPEIDLDRSLDLWRRLTAIALTMARVNDRRQLIEFDVAICRDFLSRLAETRSDEVLSRTEIRDLRQIWGRDPALDAMLDQPATSRGAALEPELKRILADLERQLRMQAT